MHKPTENHLAAAKRVLRYIKGTSAHGIWYKKDTSVEMQNTEVKLLGFCDSDWAGSVDDMKSTSGYTFTVGSGVVSWSSKKQETVAQSSAEAESLMESKLKSGTTLIVDRYSYSGVAFSAAKGLDIEWSKASSRDWVAGPDLVLFLDIPPEKAVEGGGYGGERYVQLEFQQKVSQHYQILHDSTWLIIDASLPMEDVEKQLRELVLNCLTTCQKGKPLSQLWLW
ncbi:dTMP kinase [Ranunculus cassubicifolius]